MTDPIVNVHLPVRPIPKGRPRAARRGNRVVVYTPPRTEAFEQEVRWLLKAAVRKRNDTDNLAVTVTFDARDNRSDIDNFVKAMFDASNEVVWADDKQVTELHAYLNRNARNTGINYIVTTATNTTEET